MSLFITSLNSGSNGNCYYVGNEKEAVLIDAGISCRETERRLLRLELSIKKIKGIFITHEHSDHIYGVSRLSRRHEIPVYITPTTMARGRIHLKDHLMKAFRPYQTISIGDLVITGFPKLHDAVDPHSFMVSCRGINVGVFTDIGRSCKHVAKHFEQCHAAFLESNYDVEMLDKGSYPIALKNRIRDGRGHLSNMEALHLFVNHRPAFMTHLLLSHLSENNNKPQIVEELFNRMAGRTEIIIASRDNETPVYSITSEDLQRIRLTPKPVAAPSQMQLPLFQ
ncbi:MAG: MBL fold metallo-hydrolase [Cyclobacteriaceae bacterium]|nr:MBL fold metallo-hydrolase [Cyclobacteriaceae bacterium]